MSIVRGNAVDMPEWLECASPIQLASFLLLEASPRKAGLLIRHLCRCFPEVFFDPRSWAALDAADQHEAAKLDRTEFLAAMRAAGEAERDAQVELEGLRTGRRSGREGNIRSAATATRLARQVAYEGFYPAVMSDLRRAILDRSGGGGPRRNVIARVIRPIFFEHFGDPRPPVALDPDCRTSTVIAITQGMYDSCDFSAMPILADALQDAGCENSDILDHCRGLGPHVRGCWVVDLVLGKE